ncbi:MAG: MaoC family dehydratase [Betaproteobacteria bacterium]|nr:MaoC family dehydratase [Betaproteobacteria bacterium]
MKPRPLQGYFLEDYHPGQRFHHATPRTLSSGDVSLYIALTGARQPLYSAYTVAQKVGYPACPVDDLLVFHIAFGKTVPDISYNAIANLGYADVRFLRPVFVGDTLRTETEILGVKENSNGKTGVVTVHSEAFNQHNEAVLTWIRWVMIAKRDEATPLPPQPSYAPHVPACVEPALLAVPPYLQPSGLQAHDSGSGKCGSDYAIGEIIDHPAGMTIDESDHTLATKLYQNTARVHFDAHHMKASRFGRRLIYGGHIISLCRAISFDGLENAISIAAINAGSHRHPCFAGDTLYAKSQVLAHWSLGNQVSALRLRLLGIKNATPESVTLTEPLPDSVVLDLDYTVLMPDRTPL